MSRLSNYTAQGFEKMEKACYYPLKISPSLSNICANPTLLALVTCSSVYFGMASSPFG